MGNGCIGIVVAAGTARRMGGIDKILTPLDGVPLLLRTVRALAASERIDAILIVTRADLLGAVRSLCAGERKVKAVIAGGESRTESVLCGLRAAEGAKLAAIHDGARPLTPVCVINAAIEAAETFGAAAPAIAVHDTIKIARQGTVVQTPERSTLFAVQTPQVFRTEQIRQALESALANGCPLTDDCSALELLGVPVHLTMGSEENIKITVPSDLAVAETILRRGRRRTVRIGHGYDVHRLTEGRKLLLGGVEIPFERGLDGHSDADVLLHAVMDALLGAAAMRDIGVLFPDTDPQYRGISSLLLLETVIRQVEERGLRVGNVDVTVLAQRPKLKDYIPQMQQTLAGALHVPPERVNIKATTEEGLGFTGSGQAIACHAVCLLEE